jgi:hypothetical protein
MASRFGETFTADAEREALPFGAMTDGPMTLRRLAIHAGVLALCLAACGTPAPSATPTPTPLATPSPVETAAASPTVTRSPTEAPAESSSAAASAAGDTFVSTLYPYALTLPPHSLLLVWHAAERPWDGQARVDMAGSYVDRTSIAEGGLFLISAPTGDLDAFFTAFVANGTRFHNCTEGGDRVDTTIDDVPAIAFTQECEGVGFGRVALFKDGHGIGAWITTLPGEKVPARDRLIELLDGLEWRTG